MAFDLNNFVCEFDFLLLIDLQFLIIGGLNNIQGTF